MPKRVSLKGKGADLFFGDYPSAPTADPVSLSAPGDAAHSPPSSQATPPPSPEPMPPGPSVAASAPPPQRGPSRSRPNTSKYASQPASVLASPIASKHASGIAANDEEVVESIRQVIKVPGREVSFVRLTAEEKARLSDIVYTYKRQGQKTSETEINRIAINYLLLDFHEHGEQSVLARVLAALRA